MDTASASWEKTLRHSMNKRQGRSNTGNVLTQRCGNISTEAGTAARLAFDVILSFEGTILRVNLNQAAGKNQERRGPGLLLCKALESRDSGKQSSEVRDSRRSKRRRGRNEFSHGTSLSSKMQLSF